MAKTAQKNKAEKLLKAFPVLPADTENSKLTKLLKAYLSQKEIELVWEAYRYSDKAHAGQKRIGGEAYISHPVSVACIASKFHLDAASIQAAIDHTLLSGAKTFDLGGSSSCSEVSEQICRFFFDVKSGNSLLNFLMKKICNPGLTPGKMR